MSPTGEGTSLDQAIEQEERESNGKVPKRKERQAVARPGEDSDVTAGLSS